MSNGKSQRGAAGQQYAIVIGLIAVVSISAITLLGTSMSRMFTNVGNQITRVNNQADGQAASTTADTTPPLDARWRSQHNNNVVRTYPYNGPSTTLTWQIQHDVCAANGKNTPGSSHPSYLNQYCSYSATDNYIVTGGCNWSGEGFAYVQGTIPAGKSAWMCAHLNCDLQKRAQGTTMTANGQALVTINPGDYVFCSP